MHSHDYWLRTATDDSRRGVARTIGVDSGQLTREVQRGLTADRVISIARAYGLNIVTALVDTGHLAPYEADRGIPSHLDAGIADIARRADELHAACERLRGAVSPHAPHGR